LNKKIFEWKELPEWMKKALKKMDISEKITWKWFIDMLKTKTELGKVFSSDKKLKSFIKLALTGSTKWLRWFKEWWKINAFLQWTGMLIAYWIILDNVSQDIENPYASWLDIWEDIIYWLSWNIVTTIMAIYEFGPSWYDIAKKYLSDDDKTAGGIWN
jgi:hypothetical protein